MIKKFLLIFIGLFLSIGFIFPAKAYVEEYKETIGFDDHYIEAYDLERSEGNDRLRAKMVADIERASKPTVHYDEKVKSQYMCDWQYDKVLGRWVCGKDYQKAYYHTNPQPIPVCSYGYKLNYTKTACVKISVPENAILNARGDGWQCLPGFHVNNSGTACLSNKEYVYTQCPGGTPTCDSSCTGSCAVSYTLASSTSHAVTQPQNVSVIPVGYTVTTVNYIYSNAHADGNETDTHYAYVYPQNGDQTDTQINLAQTGPSTIWILVLGLLGVITVGVGAITIK